MQKKEEQKVNFWKKMRIFILVSAISVLVLSISAAAAGTNLSTATSISSESTVWGTLRPSYGVSPRCDYYRFSLSENSVIYFDVRTGGHSQKVSVNILNSSGKSIYIGAPYTMSTSDPYNWGYQSVRRYMALNKGTYFIKVSNYFSREVSYAISTSIQGRQKDNTKIAAPGNEFLKDAVPIVIGNRLFSVAYPKEHYYKFTLSQAQTIRFQSKIMSDAGKVFLNLYNGSGRYIKAIRGIAYGQTYTDTLRLEAGTYFIGAKKYSDCVRYEVKTSTVKNSQKITTKVSSKTYKKSTIDKKSQSFSINAKAKTRLTYSSSNSKYVTVSSNGKVTVKKGAKKGTYTITVKAATSSAYLPASKKITITIK